MDEHDDLAAENERLRAALKAIAAERFGANHQCAASKFLESGL